MGGLAQLDLARDVRHRFAVGVDWVRVCCDLAAHVCELRPAFDDVTGVANGGVVRRHDLRVGAVVSRVAAGDAGDDRFERVDLFGGDAWHKADVVPDVFVVFGFLINREYFRAVLQVEDGAFFAGYFFVYAYSEHWFGSPFFKNM